MSSIVVGKMKINQPDILQSICNKLGYKYSERSNKMIIEHGFMVLSLTDGDLKYNDVFKNEYNEIMDLYTLERTKQLLHKSGYSYTVKQHKNKSYEIVINE